MGRDKVATTSFSFITKHSTRKIGKKILPGEDVTVNKMPIFFSSDNTHHLCAIQTECIEMDDFHNFDNIFIIHACDGSAINAYIVITLFYKNRHLHQTFLALGRYAAITIRFSYQATSLSLSSSLLYFIMHAKTLTAAEQACIETSETFKMSTHLFIIQPLYHWHALVDDYLPLTQANAPDLESHPARLS